MNARRDELRELVRRSMDAGEIAVEPEKTLGKDERTGGIAKTRMTRVESTENQKGVTVKGDEFFESSDEGEGDVKMGEQDGDESSSSGSESGSG